MLVGEWLYCYDYRIIDHQLSVFPFHYYNKKKSSIFLALDILKNINKKLLD